MNDEQLKRSLQSIGMACFVEYFPRFGDLNISNEHLSEIFIREKKCIESTRLVTSAASIK